MTQGMDAIEHVVVLMLENRSFDNLLGWLHADSGNRPPHILPEGDDRPFDGVDPERDWNPAREPGAKSRSPKPIAVTRGTGGAAPYRVPDPGPNEGFRNISRQIFGTESPEPGQAPTMKGFVIDYRKALRKARISDLLIFVFACVVPPLLAAGLLLAGHVVAGALVLGIFLAYLLARHLYWPERGALLLYLLSAVIVGWMRLFARRHDWQRIMRLQPTGRPSAARVVHSLWRAKASQIMACYSPEQVPVLSALARSYAVCDAWFASCPTQTLPNRAFVHAGTACGNVENPPAGKFNYDSPTLFNVLEDAGISWRVYNAGSVPSLARLQMQALWDKALDSRFASIEAFHDDARNGRLPAYTFLEPTFYPEQLDDATSAHPPADVSASEHFLAAVWKAVRESPCWPHTLLVVTFDEHGGCFDHVPPPWGATPPDAASNPGAEGFRFDRFGVRVPTILISPHIAAGTVFRAPGPVPYDHTSIAATVLDWLGLDRALLPSARVAQAPSFANVLTLSEPRDDASGVEPAATPRPDRLASHRPLSDLEKAILVASIHAHEARGTPTPPTGVTCKGALIRHLARASAGSDLDR